MASQSQSEGNYGGYATVTPALWSSSPDAGNVSQLHRIENNTAPANTYPSHSRHEMSDATREYVLEEKWKRRAHRPLAEYERLSKRLGISPAAVQKWFEERNARP